jgi:predicted metal-dependent phosphoesterase TrpH
VFADLHLHTRYSDGTFTPAQLAAEGHRHGLAVMAVTDHDTVEGCGEMAEACARLGIEFVPGVELTAEFDGIEIHLLAYFMDIRHPEFLARMIEFQGVRQQRIRDMVTRLNQMQISIRVERVFELANCRAPGRPHVARVLVESGICTSHEEAFDRFLKKNRPAWVPKFKISAADAISLVHRAGGLAVMAHPGLNRADDIIPDLVTSGLDGIECFHTKHSTTTSAYYLEIADRFGLLVTGGSDCHGLNKGKPLVGTMRLPLVYVEKMKSRLAERRGGTVA